MEKAPAVYNKKRDRLYVNAKGKSHNAIRAGRLQPPRPTPKGNTMGEDERDIEKENALISEIVQRLTAADLWDEDALRILAAAASSYTRRQVSITRIETCP
uniref:Uncharacterized protein n=1 Tax=viral metagenome TaxID=1070528 RepID=A0A6M3KRC6_9ZZZZ